MLNQKINVLELVYMQKPSNKTTWKKFEKKNVVDKFKFLSERKPMACPISQSGQYGFWPELDGIVIHLNKKCEQYKTEKQAFDVATRISELIVSFCKAKSK